jgi:hypothetical protein
MKILIKESSLIHLIATFLDEMDHPKGVCFVGAKFNDNGDVVLDVHIKKEAYIVFGAGTTVGQLRTYYTDKVSSYFSVNPKVYFELERC